MPICIDKKSPWPWLVPEESARRQEEQSPGNALHAENAKDDLGIGALGLRLHLFVRLDGGSVALVVDGL